MTIFSSLEYALPDPIFGLKENFDKDLRTHKINLGIGVYISNTGKIPILRSVYEAEKSYVKCISPHSYLPIEGNLKYTSLAQKLIFGEELSDTFSNQIVTVQTVGGTGALKIGADFLKLLNPNSTVLISDPSWENHKSLFEYIGFKVKAYPYYDKKTNKINIDKMISELSNYSAGTIVVLHACCHNPTGFDLNIEQWNLIIQTIIEYKLIPFIDIAYQGFGDGINIDATAVRLFTQLNLNILVASSFSKSFSLYNERVGSLSVIVKNKKEGEKVLSQLKRIIRANYSNPPNYGSLIVSSILNSSELKYMWETELNSIRNRISSIRSKLVNILNMNNLGKNFNFINNQKGMFSYVGLTSDHIKYIRNTFGIYLLNTGRVCIAALNEHNLNLVANAISQSFKKIK